MKIVAEAQSPEIEQLFLFLGSELAVFYVGEFRSHGLEVYSLVHVVNFSRINIK